MVAERELSPELREALDAYGRAHLDHQRIKHAANAPMRTTLLAIYWDEVREAELAVAAAAERAARGKGE